MLNVKNRLRKEGDFAGLYKKGKKKYNRNFSLYYLPGTKKIGIVVSKKHGKAVKRNLLKRRIRGVFEEILPDLAYADLVIIPRVGAGDLSYTDLRNNIIHVLKLGGLLK